MHDLLSRRSMRGCRLIHSPATALVLPALLSLVTGCQDPAAPTPANLNALPPAANLEAASSLDTLDLALATPSTQGMIAFASDRSGNYDIYLLDVGTGRTHRLTRDKGGDNAPAWSPDGQKIAFSGTRDGNTDIYVMSAAGGDPTRLTTTGDWDDEPAWSPDGAKIAYSSGSGLGGGDVWVRNADGTGSPVNLTNNGAFDASPTWSPDGTKIAFVSTRGPTVGTSDFDIWVMNANGSGATRLTLGGGQFPAWSPNGQQIAFTTFRDGNWEIYVVNADGTGSPVNLTNTPDTGELSPRWSSDGSKITFSARAFDGRSSDIYVMNADGSGVAQVARSSGSDQKPAWRP
jgi:Tol biopolymer transport system component